MLFICMYVNLKTLTKKTNTVFCRIHAPARTPKNTEGRLYSGIIISKTERYRAASGIPELAVLMAGKSLFMRTQLAENKWLLVILEL